MQRQRGELVPIGEVVVDLDGPVQAIREGDKDKKTKEFKECGGVPPPRFFMFHPPLGQDRGRSCEC